MNEIHNDLDLKNVQKENLLNNNSTSHGKRSHSFHSNHTLSLKTIVIANINFERIIIKYNFLIYIILGIRWLCLNQKIKGYSE